jgi:phage terminase small subunit
MAGKPGRSGRRRKPSTLRKGHRRYNNVEPTVPDGPIVPPPLSPGGLVVWARLLPQVESLRIMTPADAETLGILCELIALFNAKPNAKVAQTIRSFLVEFGLSPSSRASLNVIPERPSDEDSPYAGMDFLP